MKSIVIAFMLVLLLVVPANAAKFIEIHRDEDGIISVDTDSVISRSDYVVAWVKAIPRGRNLKSFKEVAPKASFVLEFIAFNKQQKQFQALIANYYDEKGNSLASDSSPFARHKYQEIAPNTLADYIYDTVMRIYKQKTSQ